MAAALSACEGPNQVTVFESQKRVGRKLLATGNGRCNLTNLHTALNRYHGSDPQFAQSALERFDPDTILRWFSGLGLITTTESSGRVYPITDTAASVVDVLRLALEQHGATVLCAKTVVSIERKDGCFRLVTADRKKYIQDRVIIACGGVAGARQGGTSSGYDLLQSLGHKRTDLYPALVQIKTDNTYTQAMKGIRTQAILTLKRGETVLASSRGEIQFTNYGLSGPAALDLSRSASLAGDDCTITIQLIPEMDKAALVQYMEEKKRNFPQEQAVYILSGALHNAIARVVLKRAQIPHEMLLKDLSRQDLILLAETLHQFDLPLWGTLGFDDAQITAGGIETASFDPHTMQSRLVPGLYACGEVLDIDGDCGGYNLQWAWSSGCLAGISAGNSQDEVP